jgi:RNA polymerase sigma-70 factor (ECF subfamily)
MTEDEYCGLYLRMRTDVFAFAARRLGRHLADDVVGETFEVIWRKRDSAPAAAADWPAWAVGIARNKIRQELQRQRRWADQSGRYDSLSRLSVDGADSAVVDSLLSREIYLSLSDEQRELFDLAHLRGLTTAGAARVMGISPATYRTRISRLRKLLKHRLAHEVPGEELAGRTPSPAIR